MLRSSSINSTSAARLVKKAAPILAKKRWPYFRAQFNPRLPRIVTRSAPHKLASVPLRISRVVFARFPSLTRVFLPLLFVSCLAACATKQAPEIQTQIVYPVLPQTTCLDNPVLSPAPSDTELAVYTRKRFDAGEDCRTRLKAVHDKAAQWPRGQSNVGN